MKKNTIKENVNYLKKKASKMPKTIKETMEYGNFNEEDDELLGNDDFADEPKSHDNGEMDVMAFVDDIRKKSLKGMAQLADNPDDERYQLLKKIWQICDKKPEQQTAFGNHNQQQQEKPLSNSQMA